MPCINGHVSILCFNNNGNNKTISFLKIELKICLYISIFWIKNMSCLEFFVIGNIDNIPITDNLGNKWDNPNTGNKITYIDNVIVIINNLLESEYLFGLDLIKGKPNIHYRVSNEEDSPRYTEYGKLFVILRNNTPSANLPSNSLIDKITERTVIQVRKYADGNEDWDEVFQVVRKNMYVKPWYLKLWEAIPTWSPLK